MCSQSKQGGWKALASGTITATLRWMLTVLCTLSSPWHGEARLLLHCTPQLEKHGGDRTTYSQSTGPGCLLPPPHSHIPVCSCSHPHLTEAELPIKVFIHFLDHVLQPQVGLWGSQLFHHQLQLHQVDVPIPSRVIPAGCKGEGVSPHHPPLSVFPEEEPCKWIKSWGGSKLGGEGKLHDTASAEIY